MSYQLSKRYLLNTLGYPKFSYLPLQGLTAKYKTFVEESGNLKDHLINRNFNSVP
jgi:hypothetical protein